MSAAYKNCQSCGIPFSKDPNQGGSNTDGSKSTMYCSYCYKDGTFVRPEWTVADMQQYVVGVLKKNGIPEFIGKMLTKEIPKLERWNTSSNS